MEIPKKITIPHLSQKTLYRETLIKRLIEAITDEEHQSHYNVIVLCAPAGYGKSTLLSQFARRGIFPCCWYFFDEDDTDKVTFLVTLIRSLRQSFPDFGHSFDVLLGEISEKFPHSLDSPEGVLESIIKAITAEISERFVLIFGNYQVINGRKEINMLVNQLIQSQPPQCKIIIESRAVPNLNFVSLLAYDKIIGFDQSFFTFTPQEIHDLALLQGIPPLKKTEAQTLIALFGGWISGIFLGTRLGARRVLNAQREAVFLNNQLELHLDRQKLFSYMINEVFREDLELFSLLKEASILQEMEPALINDLFGVEDIAPRLHYLEQQGLFAERHTDGSRTFYLLHPILRDVLYETLRREHPERFLALHQWAMHKYIALDEKMKAIYHAFEAGLFIEATNLVSEVGEQKDTQGQDKALIHWIDLLLSKLAQPTPEILLLRINAHLQSSEYYQVLPLLARATEILSQPDQTHSSDLRILLQSRLWLAQSKVAFEMREYTSARELCLLVTGQTPADEVDLHIEAQTRIGICSIFLDNLSQGVTHLQKALHLRGRSDERRQTAEIHDALARAYGMLGNFSLADHHLARASKCWERVNDDYGKINNLLCSSLIRHYQENLDVAVESASKALALTRGDIPFPFLEAHALSALGSIFMDQGLYDQALTCLEDALELAEKLQNRRLLNDICCNLANVYLLMQDAETASLILSRVNQETLTRRGDFERARYEKTFGTILLFQKHYSEAYACFIALASIVRALGYEYGLFNTLLRLAECQVAQQEFASLQQTLQELAGIFARNNYRYLLRREMKYLPLLQQAIETRPELSFIRTLFYPDKAPLTPAPIIAQSSTTETEKSVPTTNILVAVSSVSELSDIEPQKVTTTFSGVVQTGDVSLSSVQHTPPEIKICALGEASIIIDGKLINRWRMSRSLELFFLLLEHNRPLRKEQIINALWPDANDNINQTLHSTVYYLRKTLGENSVASDAGTYWLDLPAYYGERIWYDVDYFQAHYKSAKEALNLNNDDQARRDFEAMIEIFRGDYVQSFYSEWCVFRRENLRLIYLDARHQLAQIAWRQERYDECTQHWQHMLAVDNCLEDAHYWLMRSYIRQGKRGLALRQYQRCSRLLRSELKAEPGQAMQSLYQQLAKSQTKRDKRAPY